MAMKKITKIILTLGTLLFIFTSCGDRGPIGPEGPRGPQGEPGPEILPTSFEFNATLLPSNEFEHYANIPEEIDVLESDVVLGFVLEDYIAEDDLEVWRQLPITDFNNKGTVMINIDFTFVDVRIFMDANYSLTSSDGYEDLLVRAVHIPSNFMAKFQPNALTTIQSPSELEELLGMEIKTIE